MPRSALQTSAFNALILDFFRADNWLQSSPTPPRPLRAPFVVPQPRDEVGLATLPRPASGLCVSNLFPNSKLEIQNSKSFSLTP